MPTSTKLADISAASMTQELRSWNVQEQAFLQFVYLCAKYWQIIYAETQDSSSTFEFQGTCLLEISYILWLKNLIL